MCTWDSQKGKLLSSLFFFLLFAAALFSKNALEAVGRAAEVGRPARAVVALGVFAGHF